MALTLGYRGGWVCWLSRGFWDFGFKVQYLSKARRHSLTHYKWSMTPTQLHGTKRRIQRCCQRQLMARDRRTSIYHGKKTAPHIIPVCGCSKNVLRRRGAHATKHVRVQCIPSFSIAPFARLFRAGWSAILLSRAAANSHRVGRTSKTIIR